MENQIDLYLFQIYFPNRKYKTSYNNKLEWVFVTKTYVSPLPHIIYDIFPGGLQPPNIF